MPETAQEYTARILNNLEGRDAWDVLATSPRRARELTSDATSDELAYAPSPDRWSIVQILAHLADSEIVGAWRFRTVLGQDGVTLQAYDQNVWASTFRYEQADPAECLDMFDIVRRSTVRLLRRVDSSLHENAGKHEERGRESIAHLVRLYAGHDLNHLAQIERLLAEVRGGRMRA